MRFDFFPKEDVLLVLLCKPIFSLYSVLWVGAVSTMCDICLFLVFDGLPHVFSCVYELLINDFTNYFQKTIDVSSVLRKYFIYRYAFNSVHATKKEKLGWATKLLTMHYPHQYGIQSLNHESRNCGFPTPPLYL